MYLLVIYEKATDKEEKSLRYASLRAAEKAQRGLDMQMDHEKFYSQIEVSNATN